MSLAILALGLTYKWVENAHSLKLSEKEADRLRTALDTLEETRKNEALGFKTEIDTLKETHNKEISDIKDLHQRETEKLREELHKITSVKPKFDFVLDGDIKWKATLFTGGGFSIEETPFCVAHDLQLLSFRDVYLCQKAEQDNCETLLYSKDHEYRKKCVESRAESQFRQ